MRSLGVTGFLRLTQTWFGMAEPERQGRPGARASPYNLWFFQQDRMSLLAFSPSNCVVTGRGLLSSLYLAPD